MGGGGSRWRSGWGSQGGCEQRIEIFEKIHKQKKIKGGGVRVGGVRVDMNEELKFCVKIKKKNFFFGGGVGFGGGQDGCE